jgi:hypothetical protein
VVVKLLLEVDADADSFYSQTPLWLAAGMGHEAVVKLLLVTSKVDADSKDSDGRTPLSWAVRNDVAWVLQASPLNHHLATASSLYISK